MSEEKLDQSPVFEFGHEKFHSYAERYGTYRTPGKEFGMSKRFYAACMAMQGLLSNPNLDEWSIHLDNVHEKLAQSAYQYADELLKQEQL